MEKGRSEQESSSEATGKAWDWVVESRSQGVKESKGVKGRVGNNNRALVCASAAGGDWANQQEQRVQCLIIRVTFGKALRRSITAPSAQHPTSL